VAQLLKVRPHDNEWQIVRQFQSKPNKVLPQYPSLSATQAVVVIANVDCKLCLISVAGGAPAKTNYTVANTLQAQEPISS
jgi:hypothetical protein